jgi:hypothetical protein
LVSGAEAIPMRGGACCSRAIAVESSNQSLSFLRTTSSKLLAFEAANRRGTSIGLDVLFAETLDLYHLKAVKREQAAAFMDDILTKHPDLWILLDTCVISVDAGLGSWAADCRKVYAQDGGVGEVIERLVWSGPDGRISAISDKRPLRKLAAP